MLKLLVLSLATAAVMASPWDFPMRDYKITPLGKAIDKASVKLLKEAFDEAGGANVISSPLGAFILLSLYSTGTDGQLRQDIVNYLGVSNYTELVQSYRDLSRRFNSMGQSYLTLANKIYVAEGMEVAPQFKTQALEYESDVDKLDFSKPAAAVEVINKWAEEKTRGHLKQAVPADAITPDVVAALFNVIYFQGHWHIEFDAKDTKVKDFHVSKTEKVQKPMMHHTGSLFYHASDKLGARLVELPYKESGFRMVVVLPNEVDGLKSVLDKVNQDQNSLLDEIFELSPAGAQVDLLMPKFDIESALDLKQILSKIGLNKLFTDPALGIVRNTPVKISAAFQKAFIKVDEEGAIAGAFTGFIAVLASYPPPPPRILDFHVDHPFLFTILHDDVILFIGTVLQ